VERLNGLAGATEWICVHCRLDVVLTFALAQLGKPYLFGGTGPESYDCSGLVAAAYRTAMITLPRTSGPQYLTGVAQGPTVPLTAAEPGDLIFFNPGEAGAPPDQPGHVGIYLGDGMMIDAHTSEPSSAKNLLAASGNSSASPGSGLQQNAPDLRLRASTPGQQARQRRSSDLRCDR